MSRDDDEFAELASERMSENGFDRIVEIMFVSNDDDDEGVEDVSETDDDGKVVVDWINDDDDDDDVISRVFWLVFETMFIVVAVDFVGVVVGEFVVD